MIDAEPETKLTPSERQRRAEILCTSTLLNIAYFRGHSLLQDGPKGPFEIAIVNNFLDMAVLDWCKLFGDAQGTLGAKMQQHSWRVVIADATAFEVGLLKKLSQSREQFDALRREVRTYRDKFVAHLDELKVARVPLLNGLKASAAYYLDYLHASEQLADLYYREREAEAEAHYRSWRTHAGA